MFYHVHFTPRVFILLLNFQLCCAVCFPRLRTAIKWQKRLNTADKHYLSLKLSDSRPEEEHVRPHQKLGHRSQSNPAEPTVSPPRYLYSGHPVNSAHPAKRAVFAWWSTPTHHCTGCRLSHHRIITERQGRNRSH